MFNKISREIFIWYFLGRRGRVRFRNKIVKLMYQIKCKKKVEQVDARKQARTHLWIFGTTQPQTFLPVKEWKKMKRFS